MGLLKKDKFSPFLFMGLGGSGGKIVNAMAAKLTRHPNWARIRELCHFVVIDTNKADLNQHTFIPASNRFLISSFDRRSYIARKRGTQELDRDTMVTQWVHDDYQFRSAQGAGAGQIRVESRLGLYYNLENDRAGIRNSLGRMIDAATKPNNAYRDNEDRVVNCLIYASVAGGTGSGAFLPVSYLLQDLVAEQGWGRANVVGNLMMPSVFARDVEHVLHDDINANAYAALKELEHLTRLGYEGMADGEPFHYDPTRPDRRSVAGRPFSLAYLIDKPAELSIERYTAAIADSSYLQIFSPMLGAQAGEYDNYDKHQKSLALDHFTVHYAAYGSSVVVFPREDVLEFAGLRYVARAFEKYLSFGDDPQFAVPYDDERFQLLDPKEQDRIIDEKYTQWIQHQARLQEEAGLKGVYVGIRDQKAPDGQALRELFRRKLERIFEGIDERVEIDPYDPMDVTEQKRSLSAPAEKLRRQLTASRSRVMGDYLESQIADLRTDRFFSDFFKSHKVDPLSQRYFLILLAREGQIGPSDDPEEDEYLFDTKENASDFDSQSVRDQIKDIERNLERATERGLLDRLRSDNPKWMAAKKKVQNFFDEIEDGNRVWLKASFWRAFHDALKNSIEARLSSFRDVAKIASQRAQDIAEEARRFEKDPASVSQTAKSAEYYLDIEVMRDDHAEQRLWSRFFAHRLDRHENYNDESIFGLITTAFAPVQEGGRMRKKDASEVVTDIRAALAELARETFARAIADMPDMNLAGALELEARYSLAGPDVIDDAALAAVEWADVERYIRDKLQRAMDHCVLLANVDKTKFDDQSVTPNRVFYVGMAREYQSDEPDSLKQLTSAVEPDVSFIEGWDEPDMIVFYRALLGVPVYFFARVGGELYGSYARVKDKPNRSYPLHIDKNWEELPNLDPKEIKEAEEKRRAEAAALVAQQRRMSSVWTFTLSVMLGNIQHKPDGYYWSLDGVEGRLSDGRVGAFDEFLKLDAGVRDHLAQLAEQTEGERTVSARERERFVDDLKSHLGAVRKLYFKAVTERDDRAKNFLTDEKAAIEDRIESLEA